MDFFKKKEPLIQAEVPTEASHSSLGAPAAPLMTGAGGLTSMVEQTLKLEQENNRILRHMQTMDRVGFWIKLLVWGLVLGLPVIFFQPMLEFAKKTVQENPSAFGIPSPEAFQNFVDSFGAKEEAP